MAQGGPHLDHPHRREQADQGPHPDHGDGDLRPRVLEQGRQENLVRPADAARRSLLAGVYDVETGERRWYHLERNEWSIHFNVTKDEKTFCGDGGDHGQVAKAKDGQWIYLFRADPIANRGNEDKSFVKPGVLRSERLVNMSKHNYRLEPNVSFSPDEKWVIFRSNMLGPTYTFAVEVEKAK